MDYINNIQNRDNIHRKRNWMAKSQGTDTRVFVEIFKMEGNFPTEWN